MENKKDGSVFIAEANKFPKLKINNKLHQLFEQIIYIIRFKENDSTEALTEIDELITEYKKEVSK